MKQSRTAVFIILVILGGFGVEEFIDNILSHILHHGNPLPPSVVGILFMVFLCWIVYELINDAKKEIHDEMLAESQKKAEDKYSEGFKEGQLFYRQKVDKLIELSGGELLYKDTPIHSLFSLAQSLSANGQEQK